MELWALAINSSHALGFMWACCLVLVNFAVLRLATFLFGGKRMGEERVKESLCFVSLCFGCREGTGRSGRIWAVGEFSCLVLLISLTE